MTNSGAREPIPHRRLIWICGVLAAAAGIIALLGWGLGLLFLASLGSGKIPMAPSTALLFVLHGAAAFLRTRSPLRRGEYWLVVVVQSAGTLVASLLCVLSSQGIYLDAEHLGFPAVGTVGGVPIGHMSPVTALCFLLASLSFLASLPSSSERPRRAAAAWSFACLLLAACSVLLLAYLYGTPLLYAGSFIPPAATTSLAFAALGTALLALAGPQAWPQREPDGAATRPAPVLFLVFALLAVGIVTAGYLYARSYEAQYRAEVERQLSSVAELKVGELVQYRKERLGDGSLLFENAVFSALVQRVLDDPADGEAHAQLQMWLGKYQAHDQYDRVFLLDAQGAVRMSVPESPAPIAGVMSRRTAEVLQSAQVVFQDFYQDEHDQRIHLAVLVPILGGSDSGRALGLLALQMDPETYLYPFLSRWPTPSETAETLLIRRDGNDALYLNGLKFLDNAPLTVRIPLERQDVPAVKAALGQEGIVNGVDYRGVPVIASLRAVPDSPWFLVARLDASEVHAPLRQRIWTMVVLVGALLLSAGAGLAGVWRQQRARFYREKYQADLDLRESQATSQAIVRSTADGILAVGTDNKVLLANERFVEMWAIPQEVMASNDDAVLLQYTLDQLIDPQGFLHKVQELYHSQEDSFDTLYFKDGRIFDRQSRPLMSGTERHGRVWSFRDITERTRVEAALRSSEAQLRSAQKMEALGTLAGGIAHDFNNILGAVIGNVELAAQDIGPSHEAMESLNEIRKASRRAKDLVQRILAFSRHQPQAQSVIPLRSVVEEVLTLLRASLPAGVELTTTFDADAPAVLADPTQVHQVLMNLCTNAWHALEGRPGRIDIRLDGVTLDAEAARADAALRPGCFARLCVTDTGAGMDTVTLERIYEPFFTTKPLGQGTGLGLSVVHGIVNAHRGAITVTSLPGRGTTFSLYFPAVQASEQTAAPQDAATEPDGRGETRV